MDDLISRQAAIEAIAKWMLEYGGEGEERERNALKQAAEEIKGLSSAQPEIIRCRDCKWWGYDDETGDVRVCHAAKHGHISSHWYISIRRVYRGDFYCADAERRTDE